MNPSKHPSALRSKNLLTETLLCLIKQYPYREITVKHILLESGISRKTFYRNFLSKDDILDSYINAVLYQYLAAIKKQGEYSMLSMLEIIFPFCEAYKDLLFLLRDNGLLYLFLQKLNRLVWDEHRRITRNMQSQTLDAASVLSQYIVSFNIGGIWNMIAGWIENDMKDDTKNMKKTLVYYLQNIGTMDLRNV